MEPIDQHDNDLRKWLAFVFRDVVEPLGPFPSTEDMAAAVVAHLDALKARADTLEAQLAILRPARIICELTSGESIDLSGLTPDEAIAKLRTAGVLERDIARTVHILPMRTFR